MQFACPRRAGKARTANQVSIPLPRREPRPRPRFAAPRRREDLPAGPGNRYHARRRHAAIRRRFPRCRGKFPAEHAIRTISATRDGIAERACVLLMSSVQVIRFVIATRECHAPDNQQSDQREAAVHEHPSGVRGTPGRASWRHGDAIGRLREARCCRGRAGSEPPARRAPGRRLRAAPPSSGMGFAAAREGPLRGALRPESRLLPDGRDRVHGLRNAGRDVRGSRGRGQRGDGGRRRGPGRRRVGGPRDRAQCRARVSDTRGRAEPRARPESRAAPAAAPLRAVPPRADGADGCVPRPPPAGGATVPSAPRQHGPARLQRRRPDPGRDCQPARRTPREHHGSRRKVAGGGAYPISPRPDHGFEPRGARGAVLRVLRGTEGRARPPDSRPPPGGGARGTDAASPRRAARDAGIDDAHAGRAPAVGHPRPPRRRTVPTTETSARSAR